MIKRILTALLFLFCCIQAATASDMNPEKASDIRRLIEVTGAANVSKQMAAASSQQMFRMLKSARPEVPDRALEIMHRELTAVFAENISAPGGLLDRIVPIYDKHLSHDEVKGLLAFYQTPLGQKLIAILPSVAMESMKAGRQWGESLAPEITRRVSDALIREGYLPPKKDSQKPVS